MHKLILLVSAVIVFMLGCQILGADVVINTVPYTESFEGQAFPPDGWTNTMVYNSVFEPGTTEQTGPAVSAASDGLSWAHLNLNGRAILRSPVLSLPTDGFYKLTMDMYKLPRSNYSYTCIKPMLFHGPTDTAGEDINYDINSDLPFDSPEGWYEVSTYLGFLDGSADYIGLLGNAGEYNVNIDNIRLTSAIPDIAVEPQDGAVNVSARTNLYWGRARFGYSYHVFMSTDNVNFSLVGDTIYQYVDPGDLEFNTTYYWFIRIDDNNGRTIDCPVHSFTTVNPDVLHPNEITEYPYFIDFQNGLQNWNDSIILGGKEADQQDRITRAFAEVRQLLGDTGKGDDFVISQLATDGDINYTLKLPEDNFGISFSPFFRMTAGSTYYFSYNDRVSAPEADPDCIRYALLQSEGMDDTVFLCLQGQITDSDYHLRRGSYTSPINDNVMVIIMSSSDADYYIDNFRVSTTNDDIVDAIATTSGGISHPDPAPVYNSLTGAPLDTDLTISNITGSPNITATVSWNPPNEANNESGLSLLLSTDAGSLAGAQVTFIHNLGYVPGSLSCRYVPNSYSTLSNPNDGTWTATACTFTVPAGKADGDFEVIVGSGADATLPVEMSSFSAIGSTLQSVTLQWTTESETGMCGYNVYRSTTDDLSSAIDLNHFVNACNSSSTHHYSFADSELSGAGTYYYWLQAIDLNGSSTYYGSVSVTLSEDDDTTPGVTDVTGLQGIYPNPFSPSTSISYSLRSPGTVKLEIYNIKGQKVHQTTQNHSNSGQFVYKWNAADGGRILPSGLYFLKMTCGDYHTTQKIILTK